MHIYCNIIDIFISMDFRDYTVGGCLSKCTLHLGRVRHKSRIDEDDPDFVKMLRFYNIFKLEFVAGFSVENPVRTWVSCMFLG